MDSLMVSVGLDYHQDSIRVCIVNEHGEELVNRDVPNHWAAVADLVAEHGDPRALAIEACCGAADFAEELHEKTDWDVRLANPGIVRRLKASPDKSDHDDAFLLADLVRVDYLPEVWLAPSTTRQMRRLVRYREQLKKTKKEVKQQLRAMLREERVGGAPGNPWTKVWLTWLAETDQLSEQSRWIVDRQRERLTQLEASLKEVDQRLAEVTAEDPVVEKLLQQDGVGPITAVTLRAEIGRFERFKNGKQLARYCGVTPCNASSGRRQNDAGLVRACNRNLRAILIEAAHRLTQHNDRWRTLKHRLMKTKPASVAVAAVANRYVRWLYHQMVPQPSELVL